MLVNIYDSRDNCDCDGITMTTKDNTLDEQIEREVKSIGEYLGCNEDELWSEMKPLIKSICMEIIGDDELNYTQRPNLLKIDPSKARCGEDIEYAIKTNSELDNKWFDYEVALHRYKLRAEQRQTLQTILNKGDK